MAKRKRSARYAAKRIYRQRSTRKRPLQKRVGLLRAIANNQDFAVFFAHNGIGWRVMRHKK